MIMEGLWLKNRNPLCHQMACFWGWKLGPAKAHYLWGPADLGEPHI